MAKPLTSWLVPSFSQHNLRLVVSGRCLHVSVTKFQDKFASLRQVNSPYSWNKFQICCTDMYLIRFLPNFAVFCVFLWISRDFADLPEFHGCATARNIRSPGTMNSSSVIYLQLIVLWEKWTEALLVEGAKSWLLWYRAYSQLSPSRTPLGPALSVRLREMSVL